MTRTDSLWKFLRCKLGWHDWKYVGLTWVEDFPGFKSGYDRVCRRCGAEWWLGAVKPPYPGWSKR